jgi:hypothetical protein
MPDQHSFGKRELVAVNCACGPTTPLICNRRVHGHAFGQQSKSPKGTTKSPVSPVDQFAIIDCQWHAWRPVPAARERRASGHSMTSTLLQPDMDVLDPDIRCVIKESWRQEDT